MCVQSLAPFPNYLQWEDAIFYMGRMKIFNLVNENKIFSSALWI